MIGNDYSATNGILVVLTLVGLDVLPSHLKRWSEAAETWLDDKPTIIVEEGFYMPLTILPVSASTRSRRDSLPVSTISIS
jgi:hypothetical protein